jgi:hypothetical protein
VSKLPPPSAVAVPNDAWRQIENPLARELAAELQRLGGRDYLAEQISKGSNMSTAYCAQLRERLRSSNFIGLLHSGSEGLPELPWQINGFARQLSTIFGRRGTKGLADKLASNLEWYLTPGLPSRFPWGLVSWAGLVAFFLAYVIWILSTAFANSFTGVLAFLPMAVG